MTHLTSIYAVWDDNAEAMAADIGVTGVLTRQWRNRGNIPSKYWPRIIDAAAKRDKKLEWTDFIDPLDRPASDASASTALCSVCELRAEDPAVAACTSPDCPRKVKDAA